MTSSNVIFTGNFAKLLFLLLCLVFSVPVKASCDYNINRASQWYFSATVTITNTGNVAVSAWDVTLGFADGTTPSGGYTNGNYSLAFSGTGPFTVTGQGNNGNTLLPGNSVSLTVQGNGGSAVLSSLSGSLCGAAVAQDQSLTLVAEVINDHGGNSGASDFGIATDAGIIIFDTPTGAGTVADPMVYTSSPIPVATGVYSLTAVDVAGYTEGSWSCTGAAGKLVGSFANGQIEIGQDENVICTIINDDIDGAIAAECVHSVNSGGSRFNGTIEITNTGILPINGWQVDWSYSDGSVIQSSYNVSRTGSNPYSGTNVSYNGNIAVGSSRKFGFSGNGGGVLASLTSSICESYFASQSLMIRKQVINDNGGSAALDDFNIVTDAGTLTFSAGTTIGNTTTYQSDKISVAPGTYSLIEDDLATYEEGSWMCSGASGAVVTTFNSGSVEITVGENVTCVITNDDIVTQPVRKNVDLAIRKDVSNTTPNIGETITFTLTVMNGGTDPATNVLVEDVLNAGFSVVTGSVVGGDSQTQSAQGLEWLILSLPVGAANAQTLSYQVMVLPP